LSDDLENFVFKCVDRYMAGRQHKRYGLVTSWDATKHLAKATIQPEGQETGWLPVQTLHMGNGWGVMVGLTTGDGKSTGDQVEISYQEGDFEAGSITNRVHSDKDAPPTVQSGEILAQHSTGSKLFLAQDGSATLTDKSGASFKFDGSGNLTISSVKALNINASGAVTITSSDLIHNGLTVGAAHVHGGVTPGGANTGIPNP